MREINPGKNGGAVSNVFGFIGLNSGSTSTVTVTGPGSSWTNSGNLFVGNSGTGTLTRRPLCMALSATANSRQDSFEVFNVRL